jgi:hypothetical protein
VSLEAPLGAAPFGAATACFPAKSSQAAAIRLCRQSTTTAAVPIANITRSDQTAFGFSRDDIGNFVGMFYGK